MVDASVSKAPKERPVILPSISQVSLNSSAKTYPLVCLSLETGIRGFKLRIQCVHSSLSSGVRALMSRTLRL